MVDGATGVWTPLVFGSLCMDTHAGQILGQSTDYHRAIIGLITIVCFVNKCSDHAPKKDKLRSSQGSHTADQYTIHRMSNIYANRY